VPGLGAGVRRLGGLLAPGLRRSRPKALGLVEFGGGYPGAYLLRRGLFLPFELDAVLDRDVVRDGLRRLDLLGRLRRGMEPDPVAPIARVAALESFQYLRNQLLRDADWAGMAHSIEIRTPLVDSRLLETLAPAIPGLQPGDGKRALAQAPATPLPPLIADRPKTGFGVPTGRWLADAAAVGAHDLTRKGGASRAWAQRVFAEAFEIAPPAAIGSAA
jgi:asparagine synthase (glutamine-hydrolysing)